MRSALRRRASMHMQPLLRAGAASTIYMGRSPINLSGITMIAGKALLAC